MPKLIITLPEEGVFLNDATEEASAAIMLTTEPGHKFTDEQIKTII